MVVIGLTGLSGSGKTLAAEIFKNKYTALVINADLIGHDLLVHNQSVQKTILKNFGTIERPELAKTVFNNPKKLKILNKIMHPEIYKTIAQILKKYKKNQQTIILEAALLFPIKLNKLCQKIILIQAPKKYLFTRLLKKGLSKQQITKRLAANQIKKYTKLCDYKIINKTSKVDLVKKIDLFMQTLL